jgi:small subunit ribosomal protein S5
MPAVPGTGVIAGATVRAVIEACGIKDIRTKAIGTTNPINCARATMEGLKLLKTPDQIAKIRDKKVEDILTEEELKAFKNSEDSNIDTNTVVENA